MSTTSIPVITSPRRNLSFAGILLSEWIKLRSIRSTWWSYAVLVVLTVGLAVQLSSSLSFDWYDGTPSQAAMQAAGVNSVMIGVEIGVLVVSVLGVLVIAGEYGTGMIHSTFTAVPKRVPALLAKALVFAAATFAAAALALVVAVPISVGLLARNGVDVRLDEPEYWRAMIGGVGYLVLTGLMAFSVGALLRNTTGGIAVAVGLVFAAPLALSLVGGFASPIWMQNLSALLPSNLGRALYAHPGYADFASPGLPLERPDGLWVLEPWQGALGLGLWVVVPFTVAVVMLKRRDA